MAGSEWAVIALAAVVIVDAAWSRWRTEKQVSHLAELLASRSYAEFAQGQKRLAEAECVKRGEKAAQKADSYNELFRD